MEGYILLYYDGIDPFDTQPEGARSADFFLLYTLSLYSVSILKTK